MDLHSTLENVKGLMRRVGEYQKKQFRTFQHGSGDEKTEREYVSHVDIESEKMLHEGLTEIFPEAAFYGEETLKDRGEYTWVVDPLDGTINYLSGIDHWAISVALLKGDEPILGVVLKPFSAETFCAIKNFGAFYNNQPLKQVLHLPMKMSLIGTGFPFRSPDTKGHFFPCAEEVLFSSRGLRRIGSAALDLCKVAAGFLQGFFEVDLEPYDAAAGLLMLQETGCQVTNFSGGPYDLFGSRTLVAGFPGVHDELQLICAKHYAGII